MLIEQVTSQNPKPIRALRPRLSRDLETICAKCLSKAPDKRYRSPAELSDDLGRFLRKEPVLARRVGQSHRARVVMVSAPPDCRGAYDCRCCRSTF